VCSSDLEHDRAWEQNAQTAQEVLELSAVIGYNQFR
jgi:hypothetical protein